MTQKPTYEKREQKFLSRLMETSPAAITVVNREGQLTLANTKAEKVLGLKRSNIYNRTYNDPEWRITDYHGHPFSEEKLPFQIVKKTRTAVNNIEHAIEWPGGKRILVSINSAPLFDSEGNFEGMISSIEDVTEKKRNEEKLRESEERYRALFEHSPYGVVILEPATAEIIEFNDQACRQLGYSREEFAQLRVPDIEANETAEETKAHIQKVLNEGYDDFETLQYTKQGEIRNIHVSAQVIEIAGNDFYHCIWRDITERKMAETQQAVTQRELVNRNQFIEMILDYLPIGLGVNYIDSGEVTYLNKKFTEIYGWSKADFPNVSDFFEKVFPDPKKRELLREKIMSDIAFGDPERMAWNDLEITTKEGERRIVSAINIPIFDQNLMISTVQDNTEKRKLESQLHQSQKLESIGHLARGIAHDFNNILFPIVGMSELLLEDLPRGDIEYENAEEILKAGKRGRDLVKQILAFSRQSEHKMVPTRIQHILKEVLKLSRSTIPTYIDIRQQIQPDCGMILADPTQIHQVAMNIITNAYHAMEGEGGRLTVQLKQQELGESDCAEKGLNPGNYALLSISDTGQGISNKLISKIFEPYFTTKEQGKGTGLGLAVVYGIVQEHKGNIKVHSEIGKGSTFDVYLPLMDRPERAEEINQVEDCLGGNERILLVDDEEPIAKLEKQMLERLGYKVTIRFSSLDALESFKIDPGRFDLVISDMSMPSMTGDRLALELITIRPDIPMIICTGFSERINQENAAGIGVKGLLMKPIVKAEMAKMVRKVLDEAKPENKG